MYAASMLSFQDSPRVRLLQMVLLTAVVSLQLTGGSVRAADGSFSGQIVLDGKVPVLNPLVTPGQPNLRDAEVCGVTDIADETLVIGEGNGIANVFVFLRRAPKGYKTRTPTDPVIMDQKGCIFLPHASLIQAGQPLIVRNSDAAEHNIHTFPNRNGSTNLLVKPNDQEGIELVYRKAESGPIQVKCDIHSWMSSYHLVLDHPFMAVTDAEGRFSIAGLPTGKHKFRIWHERGGLLEKSLSVTVKSDDSPMTLKYPAAKFE